MSPRVARGEASIGEASAAEKIPRSPGGSAQPRNCTHIGISGKKNPKPVGVGMVWFGGGRVIPGIKRLLKVRNRSAAGGCEPVRKPAGTAIGRGRSSRFFALIGARKAAQPRLLSGASSIPETGIEPASDASTKSTPAASGRPLPSAHQVDDPAACRTTSRCGSGPTASRCSPWSCVSNPPRKPLRRPWHE